MRFAQISYTFPTCPGRQNRLRTAAMARIKSHTFLIYKWLQSAQKTDSDFAFPGSLTISPTPQTKKLVQKYPRIQQAVFKIIPPPNCPTFEVMIVRIASYLRYILHACLMSFETMLSRSKYAALKL